MISARAVNTAVPRTTLAVGAAVNASRANIQHLEGPLVGSAVAVLLDWAVEVLGEGATTCK